MILSYYKAETRSIKLICKAIQFIICLLMNATDEPFHNSFLNPQFSSYYASFNVGFVIPSLKLLKTNYLTQILGLELEKML